MTAILFSKIKDDKKRVIRANKRTLFTDKNLFIDSFNNSLSKSYFPNQILKSSLIITKIETKVNNNVINLE